MTPLEFKDYIKEIQAFAQSATFKDELQKCLAYRRKLVEISRDESNDTQMRMDAYILQGSLKWAINAETGIAIRERLKKYPESSLYSNHDTLTSKCRAHVVRLAEQFEFKPQPLVHGIKHYYTVNHGS